MGFKMTKVNFTSNIYMEAFLRKVNVWADYITSYTPTSVKIINYIQETIVGVFSIVILLYVFALLSVVIFTAVKFLVGTKLPAILVFISEHEFATPRSIILLLSTITSIILTFIFIIIFGPNLNNLQTIYGLTITTLLYLVILLPLNLSYNWGFYTFIYIKGQSIKKNILFELLTDYIHLLSFFLRINIQLIRVLIILLVFYMYNDLYVELVYPTLNLNNLNNTNFIYIGFYFILKLLAHMLYEISHLWVIIGMQSGAFSMIVFIITQFLYSVYILTRIQNYFNKKSNNAIKKL